MAKDNEIEDASRQFIEDAENGEQTKNGPQKVIGNIANIKKQYTVDDGADIPESKSISMELGYMPVDLQELPSQGLFYPRGTKIFIRAAKGAEIKHWSTIDAEDEYSIDEHLNAIVERCTKVTIPGLRGSFKDLKEIDRFWLIFAIREYTFKDGENKLIADVKGEKVEVNKDVINYFNPSEQLMKHYDDEKRCFFFQFKNGETVSLSFPSVGVSAFMKLNKIRVAQSGVKIDEDFARYSLFLYNEWKGLTADVYKNDERESIGWSIQKTSLLSKFVELVRESVNPTMTVTVGAEEVTVPLNFRGGIKAIFLIPDILDELI